MIRTFTLPRLISLDVIPPSIRRWIKPMLFLSIGVHTAILLAPMHREPIPQPKSLEKKATVKLMSIPSALKKHNNLTIPNVKPRLPITPPPVITKVPKYTLKTPVRKKPVNQFAPSSKTKQKQLQPPKVTPADTPTTSSTTASAAASSDATQGTRYDPKNPMSDFPLFPGAVAGCLGLESCFETGKPLADVTQFFEKELAARKYAVDVATTETDRKVYKVAKGTESQFLSILQANKTALYVLAGQPVTMKDLQSTVQIPSDLYETVLSQLATPEGGLQPSQFSAPEPFYSELGGTDAQGFDVNPVPNSEVDNFKLAANQTPQQVFDSVLMPKFSQSGYQSKPVASGFGGGLLYEVTKNSFKPFYLNLVPTKDNSGTIVVVWRTKPA